MGTCPTCGKWGYESDETLRLLNGDILWKGILKWLDAGAVYQHSTLGDITVVDVNPPKAYDSYGDVIPSDDVQVVIKLPDGRHFLRKGYRDSYGYTEFSGPVLEVDPQPRTVTVYDIIP